jgi:hypothetical protein
MRSPFYLFLQPILAGRPAPLQAQHGMWLKNPSPSGQCSDRAGIALKVLLFPKLEIFDYANMLVRCDNLDYTGKQRPI